LLIATEKKWAAANLASESVFNRKIKFAKFTLATRLNNALPLFSWYVAQATSATSLWKFSAVLNTPHAGILCHIKVTLSS
jgi:hypothetical protein